MSVRNSLLALLATRSAHGYALKSAFEHCTAGAWPLNVGQVYTTLARLARDGLVRSTQPQDHDTDRHPWEITPAGRDALADWYRRPIDPRPPRDELAIKVLLALALESGAVDQVLQTQRTATMQRLQEYTLTKRDTDPHRQLAVLLLLDAQILKAQAELDWLDLCAARIREHRAGSAS